MHPTLDSLTAFVEQPDAAEFGETRRHIAFCGQCRRQVQDIATMIDALKKDEMSGTNQEKSAIKAALHYAAHSAAMRKHLAREPAPRRAPSWWRNFFAWRPQGWLALPATAAAAFAVAVMVLPVAVQETALIAAYQDDAEVRFEPAADAPPGLGFFHGASAKSEPFGGMQVKYDPATGLALRWAPVAGAEQYTVRVALVEAQGVRVVAEREATQPALDFAALKLQPGRRYQWTLSGIAAEGSRFEVGGGFVLANNE